MSRAWYKHYPRDFLEGTIGLTLEEKGAYAVVLNLIYCRDGPVPDNAHYLAGICGVSVRKWKILRAGLIAAGKISAENGCLFNERARIEIEAYRKYLGGQQKSGARGGRRRQSALRELARALPQGGRLPNAEELARARREWASSQPQTEAEISAAETGNNRKNMENNAENETKDNKNSVLGKGSLAARQSEP